MRRLTLLLVVMAVATPCLLLLLQQKGVISDGALFVAISSSASAVTFIAVVWMAVTGHTGRRTTQPVDPSQILYSDKFVTITPEEIIIHNYGLFSPRSIPLSAIHAVRALRPTIRNGKWRINGTSDFETWFTTDIQRFRRDTIFVIEPTSPGPYKIGFSVEDSRRVREILRQLGVLHPVCSRCGYDLRASTDLCPECGVPIERPVS